MKQETEKLSKRVVALEKENAKLQKENTNLITAKNKLSLDIKKAHLDSKEQRLNTKIQKMKFDEKIRSLEAEIIDIKKSRPTVAELMSKASDQLKRAKEIKRKRKI